ncbi:574_t:CDS:2 [Gigaspora margarita]|uniref:574_t:CDS:1 n=1 Tax=Gigaspora margarita TaxID=4874 RepID=A0ABN7VED9_GIGMA|nr:574_t:CDS:2 [Gigaspora margarita]
MQIKLNLVSLAQDTYYRDLTENEQEFKELRSLDNSNEKLESSTKKILLLYQWILVKERQRKRQYSSYGSRSSTGERERKSISQRHIATTRQWLKQKNSDLLLLIRKAVSIKEIRLSLVNIKDHSNNRWNDRADSLANILV